jgi:hypothetical protein
VAVTEPLTTLMFPDGTQATVSWTLTVTGGTVQSFTFTIPVGHAVTAQALDANGNVLFKQTVQGTGAARTVTVPTGWATAKGNAGYQLSFWGT